MGRMLPGLIAVVLSTGLFAAPAVAQPMPGRGEPQQNVAQPGALQSSMVIGARVKNAQGRDVGEIDQLLIDPRTGRVSHAVVGVGGVAGVGESKILVGWPDLRLQADPNDPRRVVAAVDQAVIERAPRWERRAGDLDRTPPAASPRTTPPATAPAPAPSTR